MLKIKNFIYRICIFAYSFLMYLFVYRAYGGVSGFLAGFRTSIPFVPGSAVAYDAMLKRISQAYFQAKAAQGGVPAPYHLSGMWQGMIDSQFSSLVAGLRDADPSRLRALLENFQREQFTFSCGGSAGDFHEISKSSLFKYEFYNTWTKYFNVYRDLAGQENPGLEFPAIGNPAGMPVANQIIPTEAIPYHYYALEIASVVRDIRAPVICEIGGGLGGQAYKTISAIGRRMQYILLDIPEVLVVSSYFLMTAFPEKKVLLFGETPDNTVVYDLVLMPHFCFPELGSDSVDLVFNSNSLSEMRADTAGEYLKQIGRVCRRYFMHINHNVRFVWREDGIETTNMRAIDMVPDVSRFKKVYQHSRAFFKIDDQIFYWRHGARHFAFLYERFWPESAASELER